jgi:hypothetical protein
MRPVRIPWRKIWTERPPPNRWLAAGLAMLGLFGSGFLLRLAFDSDSRTSGLAWLGYGGLGPIGLVLTVVGVAKGAGQR